MKKWQKSDQTSPNLTQFNKTHGHGPTQPMSISEATPCEIQMSQFTTIYALNITLKHKYTNFTANNFQ